MSLYWPACDFWASALDHKKRNPGRLPQAYDPYRHYFDTTMLCSGGPHIRFPFLGGGVPLDLRFRSPSRPNPWSRAVKSTLPGPREGSSILNAHVVVMSAAVLRECFSCLPLQRVVVVHD